MTVMIAPGIAESYAVPPSVTVPAAFVPPELPVVELVPGCPFALVPADAPDKSAPPLPAPPHALRVIAKPTASGNIRDRVDHRPGLIKAGHVRFFFISCSSGNTCFKRRASGIRIWIVAMTGYEADRTRHRCDAIGTVLVRLCLSIADATNAGRWRRTLPERDERGGMNRHDSCRSGTCVRSPSKGIGTAATGAHCFVRISETR